MLSFRKLTVLLAWSGVFFNVPAAVASEREWTMGRICSQCVEDASKVSGITLGGKIISSTGEAQLGELTLYVIDESRGAPLQKKYHYSILLGTGAYLLSSTTSPCLESMDDCFTRDEWAGLQLTREIISTIFSSIAAIRPGSFSATLSRDGSRRLWRVCCSSVASSDVVESALPEILVEIDEPSLEATVFEARAPSLALRLGLCPPLLQNTRPLRPGELTGESSISYYPIATIDGWTGQVSAGEVVVGVVPTSGRRQVGIGVGLRSSGRGTWRYAALGVLVLTQAIAVPMIVYTVLKVRRYPSGYRTRLRALYLAEGVLILVAIILCLRVTH
jgi:hypothetical protein